MTRARQLESGAKGGSGSGLGRTAPTAPVRSSSGDSELEGVTFNAESEWHESRVTSQGPGQRRAGPGVARVLDPGGYVTGQLMGSQIKTKIFAESLRTIVERLKSRPKKYWNSVQPGRVPLASALLERRGFIRKGYMQGRRLI